MKQISEKDILILMRQLDVLLEERQKEKIQIYQTNIRCVKTALN
nr:hypothetical protein [Planococcus glaciei]